jgi:hypothetical protein
MLLYELNYYAPDQDSAQGTAQVTLEVAGAEEDKAVRSLASSLEPMGGQHQPAEVVQSPRLE